MAVPSASSRRNNSSRSRGNSSSNNSRSNNNSRSSTRAYPVRSNQLRQWGDNGTTAVAARAFIVILLLREADVGPSCDVFVVVVL